MMANGSSFKCMGKVSLLGPMAGCTKANSLTVCAKDKEFTSGQMDVNTREDGKIKSSMEKGNTHQTRVKYEWENGLTGKEFVGCEKFIKSWI